MAEYINKEELDRLFSRYGLNPEHRCKAFNQVFPSFAMDKEILSTIGIVRCSECRWWYRITESKYGMCHACKHGYLSDRWDISIHRKTKEDHYCADGERKG